MNFPDSDEMIKDNGGCRSGTERRQFAYERRELFRG